MERRPARTVAALGVALVLTASCSSDDGPREPAPAEEFPAASSDGGTYLALGDSVTFGYRGGAETEYADEDDFVGFPELVAEELGLEVLNAACPGETTGSFLDTSAGSVGCHDLLGSGPGYRTANPLHVPYASADQSQLDFAVRALRGDDDVELVTLMIGANDGFLCRATTPSGCTDPADTEALATTVRTNVDTILRTLRTDAGYDGQIVVVTYYALDYSGEAATGLGSGLGTVAARHGADVADGFAAFRDRALAAGGSSVAAGLVLPDDIHPSADGQQLLADAVLAVVD